MPWLQPALIASRSECGEHGNTHITFNPRCEFGIYDGVRRKRVRKFNEISAGCAVRRTDSTNCLTPRHPPQTIGMQGALVFRGQSPLTVTGLRINPTNSFTPMRGFAPGQWRMHRSPQLGLCQSRLPPGAVEKSVHAYGCTDRGRTSRLASEPFLGCYQSAEPSTYARRQREGRETGRKQRGDGHKPPNRDLTSATTRTPEAWGNAQFVRIPQFATVNLPCGCSYSGMSGSPAWIRTTITVLCPQSTAAGC
jgi:hypothetical protein